MTRAFPKFGRRRVVISKSMIPEHNCMKCLQANAFALDKSQTIPSQGHVFLYMQVAATLTLSNYE